MFDIFDSSPVWIAVCGLYVVVTLRGQATYWLARIITEQGLRHTHPAGGRRARLHAWLQGEQVGRGRTVLHRWGVIMVPLCHLTVGLQTMVLAAAGVLRMRWWVFSLAQIPGAIAWAFIYATIGFTVWNTAVAAAAGSPWAIGALALLVVSVVAVLVLFRRRRALEPATGPEGAHPHSEPVRCRHD